MADHLPEPPERLGGRSRSFTYASLSLAAMHYRNGEFDEALERYSEALRVAERMNNQPLIAYSLAGGRPLPID